MPPLHSPSVPKYFTAYKSSPDNSINFQGSLMRLSENGKCASWARGDGGGTSEEQEIRLMFVLANPIPQWGGETAPSRGHLKLVRLSEFKCIVWTGKNFFLQFTSYWSHHWFVGLYFNWTKVINIMFLRLNGAFFKLKIDIAVLC